MNIPKDLLYSETHEWVKLVGDDTAIVGLTDFAQQSLGDIVFINLCMVGDSFAVGESLGDVESIKAVSDILSPLGGTVLKINEKALEKPELINEAPYDTWLVEMSVTDKSALIGPGEYEELIAAG